MTGVTSFQRELDYILIIDLSSLERFACFTIQLCEAGGEERGRRCPQLGQTRGRSQVSKPE